MCECVVKIERKSILVSIKMSCRLRTFLRINKSIREVSKKSRAKRMGICGNAIFVKAKKGDISSVLFEPQVRCKDRVVRCLIYIIRQYRLERWKKVLCDESCITIILCLIPKEKDADVRVYTNFKNMKLGDDLDKYIADAVGLSSFLNYKYQYLKQGVGCMFRFPIAIDKGF